LWQRRCSLLTPVPAAQHRAVVAADQQFCSAHQGQACVHCVGAEQACGSSGGGAWHDGRAGSTQRNSAAPFAVAARPSVCTRRQEAFWPHWRCIGAAGASMTRRHRLVLRRSASHSAFVSRHCLRQRTVHTLVAQDLASRRSAGAPFPVRTAVSAENCSRQGLSSPRCTLLSASLLQMCFVCVVEAKCGFTDFLAVLAA
jgi:hypothetical protein